MGWKTGINIFLTPIHTKPLLGFEINILLVVHIAHQGRAGIGFKLDIHRFGRVWRGDRFHHMHGFWILCHHTARGWSSTHPNQRNLPQTG